MGINERRGTQCSVAKLIPPAAGNNNLKVIRVFKDLNALTLPQVQPPPAKNINIL